MAVSSSAQDLFAELSSMSLDSVDESIEFGNDRRIAMALQTRRGPPSTRSVKRRVSFGQVNVREFERVLDVHPSCTSGPSISLGWKYEREESVNLDQWEEKREMTKPPSREGNQRSKSEIILTEQQREKLAKDFGYSDEEIAKNIRKIERARIRRERTVNELTDLDEKNLVKELQRYFRNKNDNSLAAAFLQRYRR